MNNATKHSTGKAGKIKDKSPGFDGLRGVLVGVDEL
jgi:hypothetical protein